MQQEQAETCASGGSVGVELMACVHSEDSLAHTPSRAEVVNDSILASASRNEFGQALVDYDRYCFLECRPQEGTEVRAEDAGAASPVGRVFQGVSVLFNVGISLDCMCCTEDRQMRSR